MTPKFNKIIESDQVRRPCLLQPPRQVSAFGLIHALLLLLLLLASILPPSAVLAADPPRCTVKQPFNFREAPGTTAKSFGLLTVGSKLEPTATGKDGSNQIWFQVKVIATASQKIAVGATGWVIANPQWLNCTPALTLLKTSLPVSNVAQPKPPEKKVAYTELPGGRAGGGFEGRLLAEQGMASIREDDTYDKIVTFQDRIYLRMEVYQTPDQRKVTKVDFRVEDEFNNTVYTHSETQKGYCLFGGGEPICNTVALRVGATWPASDLPILNGIYTVNADVYIQGDNDPGSYNTTIEIVIPGNTVNNDNLFAEFVQTGPGNSDYTLYDALAFQVLAYDPQVGDTDGAGIKRVDLWVEDDNGEEIYSRRENNAGYCAFSGGEPDCNIWYFSEHSDRWPNGAEFTTGYYYLVARVVAHDGRQKTIDYQVYFE